jgi:hypothetical protein
LGVNVDSPERSDACEDAPLGAHDLGACDGRQGASSELGGPDCLSAWLSGPGVAVLDEDLGCAFARCVEGFPLAAAVAFVAARAWCVRLPFAALPDFAAVAFGVDGAAVAARGSAAGARPGTAPSGVLLFPLQPAAARDTATATTRVWRMALPPEPKPYYAAAG